MMMMMMMMTTTTTTTMTMMKMMGNRIKIMKQEDEEAQKEEEKYEDEQEEENSCLVYLVEEIQNVLQVSSVPKESFLHLKYAFVVLIVDQPGVPRDVLTDLLLLRRNVHRHCTTYKESENKNR